MKNEQQAGAPDTVVLDVTGLSNGPDAVARHQGRVVFVPGAAPGDRVRVRLTDVHGSYTRATIVEVCGRGPAYREPPCPWVAECGGCPWQQVTSAAQLDAKARNVHETLARIGRVTPRRALPIIAAPAEFGYRHRVRFHVDPERRLGYLRARSHAVVEIGHCPIADPALSATLPALRALVRALAAPLETVDVLRNGRGGTVVAAVGRAARPPAGDEAILRGWLAATPGIAGLRLAGSGWTVEVGDPTIAVTPVANEPPIIQRPASFSQVNPEANRLLVATVVAFASPARRVLDLFCGSGNFSLPLARAGFEVIGIERSAEAIADARASAADASIRFEVANAERFLRQQGLAGADLVVLDPPRGGAPAVAEQLGRLAPRRIVYVSCDPATLARDVARLARAGYAVDRVQPIDLFPQTEHVETVLEAVRG